MVNFFHIWKWIYFAISKFAIIEEMATPLLSARLGRQALLLSTTYLVFRHFSSLKF